MYRKPILDLAEHAVERVGGVWQMELRMPLIREESGEICVERTVCRAYSLVRIVPAALLVRNGRLLVQE